MTRIIFGLLLILAGVFWLADMLLGIDLGWRWLPGVLLVIIGISLLARSGAPTSHSASIMAGLLVLLVGLAMPGSDVTWSLPDDWQVGSETLTPEVIDDGDEITHGVGELVVDLSDADVPRGASSITISNGIGEVRVTPPCSASSTITATTGVGTVRDEASGDEDSPFGGRLEITTARRGGNDVSIDVQNGIGEIIILKPDCPAIIPGLGNLDLGDLSRDDIEQTIDDLLGGMGADFSIDRNGADLDLSLGDGWPEGLEEQLNSEIDDALDGIVDSPADVQTGDAA